MAKSTYKIIPFISRPVDKRENYIKRCIGIAGDVVSMKNGIVNVNGKDEPLKNTGLMPYRIEFKTQDANMQVLTDLGLTDMQWSTDQTALIGSATAEMVAKLKAFDFVKSVTMEFDSADEEPDPGVFPRTQIANGIKIILARLKFLQKGGPFNWIA
jgi:signal peptidase I